MINTVNTNPANTGVVVVTAPGPSGPIGPQGPTGSAGTIQTNSGTIVSPFLNVNGSTIITGSLIVSGSNTFINIGPAQFTGSTSILGNLIVNGTSSATLFSGSGANLFDIPASGITGLNLSRVAIGSISASVLTGGNSFIVNNGGTNLFTISNTGLGTLSGGLIVNGSTGTFNQGLNVNNTSANLNAGVAIQGIATLNGANILTTATVSTNRITDSNISASVSSIGKAFSINNGATVLASVDQQGVISGSGLNINTGNTLINSPNIALVGAATLNGQPITTAGDLTLNQIKSGAVTASVSTGQNSFIVQNSTTTLMNVSSSGYVSASGFIGDGSQLSNVGIIYNSGSNPLISSIEVADFDNNVAVTYVNGNLKFIFGTPVVPSAPGISFNSTFETNRFNLQTDNYTTTATWAVGGYSLVRASMVDLSTGLEVAAATSGTSLPFNTTTTGNQSYRIAVTASSPLDGSINIQTSQVNGTLSKGAPSTPIITPTATVQLGSTSNQIESGATGSVSFTSAYGVSDNGWDRVSLVSSSNSPITVTATSVPSATLTANYQSPAGANSPTATTSTSTSFQPAYTRIISVRYGVSAATGFDLNQLQNLALWDTTLGGTIGTIVKGTIDPNNYQFTITTSGNYIYIVIPSSYTLTGIINVNNSNANDISVFAAPITTGGYKVYRSNNVSATTILYKLTT